jgi:hypothetical protein
MKYLLIIIFFFPLSAISGFNGLTHHSRANCLNNETISWDATRTWNMLVVSDHVLESGTLDYHQVRTGDEATQTWRAAAVHWGEGIDSTIHWKVVGFHYVFTDEGLCDFEEDTEAEDCSIYDGWWDKDPPPHDIRH